MVEEAFGRVPSKVLVQKAVRADNAKDYSNAYLMYQTAIRALLNDIKEDRKNKIKTQQLKDHVKELLRRAEELKRSQTKRDAQKSKAIKTMQQSTFNKNGLNAVGSSVTRIEEAPYDKSKETEDRAVNKKEWRFNLDLKFGMKKTTHTPVRNYDEKPEGDIPEDPFVRILYSF